MLKLVPIVITDAATTRRAGGRGARARTRREREKPEHDHRADDRAPVEHDDEQRERRRRQARRTKRGRQSSRPRYGEPGDGEDAASASW